MSNWTFGKRLAVGFTVVLALSVAMGGVAMYALRDVVETNEHVIKIDGPLVVDAERVQLGVERKGRGFRTFLLTREDKHLDQMREARRDLLATLERMRLRAPNAEIARAIAEIVRIEHDHEQSTTPLVAMRRTDATIDAIIKQFDEQVSPKRDLLDRTIDEFVRASERRLEADRIASAEAAATATTLVITIAAATLLLGALLAFFLARALSRQISTAIAQVESSAAELQAAANQQATGAKEQSTAMNEITTTINELLATSRQIAESAQRVAQIAAQTASSAKNGDGTVVGASESINAIRKQVDQVVGHMLQLGKKSQEIGAVLDIVSELAEQTNILAINATIEAAGAGEAGKRFAVVADEIRKLADRVTGSTKEIRSLIDDVRGAVNTTVMATETGSKSVDAGSKQFGEVATAFKQISNLVTTTTEAAREIELSTKQQTTAVEQVNLAIANASQATKETEASSTQTSITAAQLATLSKDLLKLVRPQA